MVSVEGGRHYFVVRPIIGCWMVLVGLVFPPLLRIDMVMAGVMFLVYPWVHELIHFLTVWSLGGSIAVFEVRRQVLEFWFDDVDSTAAKTLILLTPFLITLGLVAGFYLAGALITTGVLAIELIECEYDVKWAINALKGYPHLYDILFTNHWPREVIDE